MWLKKNFFPWHIHLSVLYNITPRIFSLALKWNIKYIGMYTYVGGLFLRIFFIYLDNVRGRENALFISPKKKYVSVNSLYSGKHKSSHEQKMLQSGSIYLYFREIYCITYSIVLFCDERMKWQHIILPPPFLKIRFGFEEGECNLLVFTWYGYFILTFINSVQSYKFHSF